MKDPLKAVSTVIELKPNKKYLLVFSDVGSALEMQQIQVLLQKLEKEGITSLGIALRKGQQIEVIERE